MITEKLFTKIFSVFIIVTRFYDYVKGCNLTTAVRSTKCVLKFFIRHGRSCGRSLVLIPNPTVAKEEKR